MRRPPAAPASLGLLALLALASPLAAQAGDGGIGELSPEQKLARRVTPEVLVVREATPAVVYIQTDTQRLVRDWWGVRPRQGRSSGSGVVLTSDGFVVTNFHVVKDAKDIRISFEKSIDDQVYAADLLSYVPEEDLALLKIRNPEGKRFGHLEMGNSSDLMIGERVLAIGNPYGHTHTVSTGIISGLHRGLEIADPQTNLRFDFDDLIQTDASINPGNSGGPLLNINGDLIGINNAVNSAAENIGFAIPINRVQEVLSQQLISPDRYNAWLGFETDDDNSREVVVQRVLPGSPAATAGLRTGDQIVGLDQDALEEPSEYRMSRLALRPGQVVNLRVAREGRNLSLPMQAWDKTDGLIYERMGIRVRRVAIGGRRYLSIDEVLPGGSAEQIGLRVDDLITAMRPGGGGLSRGWTFDNRLLLAQFIDRLAAGTELDIEIRREGDLYRGSLILD